MSYDAGTAERVRGLLSGRADIAEKKMVGGLSFVAGGHMCCGVNGTALMVRVGADDREQGQATSARALPRVAHVACHAPEAVLRGLHRARDAQPGKQREDDPDDERRSTDRERLHVPADLFPDHREGRER